MNTFSVFSWRKSELVWVVLVLVAVLAISQIQLRIGQMKTRDAQRKADVELVSRALSRYHQVYDLFPAADDGQIVLCGDIADLSCRWGQDALKDIEGVVYLTQLPLDPLADKGRRYVYQVDETRSRYRLYVALEYPRDVAWKADLTIECGEGLQCNWYVGN